MWKTYVVGVIVMLCGMCLALMNGAALTH